MATLVFDIETVARPLEQMSEYTKEKYLNTPSIQALSPEERIARQADLHDSFALSPLMGEIAAIGIYDLERHQGAVYYQADKEYSPSREGEFVYRSATEQEMLEDFWEGAQQYDVFVTFAGRGFDVPFLNIRSAAHGLTPSRELMTHRYVHRQALVKHVDLQDQFSYYGAVSKRPSLHACCEAMGIPSSKVSGVSGGDVAKLFRQKQFRDIAYYNAQDVMATVELYKVWYTHLAPSSFKACT